jgi:hypothetical protein
MEVEAEIEAGVEVGGEAGGVEEGVGGVRRIIVRGVVESVAHLQEPSCLYRAMYSM